MKSIILFLILLLIRIIGFSQNRSVEVKYFGAAYNSVSMRPQIYESIDFKRFPLDKKYELSINYNGNINGNLSSNLYIYYDKCIVSGPEFSVKSNWIHHPGTPDFKVFSKVDVSEMGIGFSLNKLLFKKAKYVFRAGLGIRIHLFPESISRRELKVSHIYSETQDSQLSNFPALAQNVKVVMGPFSAVRMLNFSGRLIYIREIKNHFSIEIANTYFYYRYFEWEGIGDSENVFADLYPTYYKNHYGESMIYELKTQFNVGLELGLNYKF